MRTLRSWFLLLLLLPLAACAPPPPTPEPPPPIMPREPNIKTRLNDEELVQQLQALSFSEVRLAEPRLILFRTEAGMLALRNSDDGNLQLIFYGSGVLCHPEMINVWNRRHRFSRAFLDERRDPVLESELLATGGINGERVKGFVNLFVSSVKEFRSFLVERCE